MTPNDPYVVNFNYAKVPDTPDQSSRSPGPTNTGVDRAGYTKAILRKKVTIEWDDGPARADGMVPFIATAVTVDFSLDPITVAVSSDYKVGSCPYRVTLKHEIEDHAQSYVKILLSYRDKLINKLNAIAFPTKAKPRWVKPSDIDALQDTLGQQVSLTVVAVSKSIVADMEKDRQAKDSPAAYAALYRQCTPAEWSTGGP